MWVSMTWPVFGYLVSFIRTNAGSTTELQGCDYHGAHVWDRHIGDRR